jgi:ADP-ribosylation factor-like protein 3
VLKFIRCINNILVPFLCFSLSPFRTDSADRKRVEETCVELTQLLEEEKLANVPLLVMANKQDLMSALTPAELTTELALEGIRARVWQLLPCSAKTGEGLQEAMEWLVEQINVNKPASDATKAGGGAV